MALPLDIFDTLIFLIPPEEGDDPNDKLFICRMLHFSSYNYTLFTCFTMTELGTLNKTI